MIGLRRWMAIGVAAAMLFGAAATAVEAKPKAGKGFKGGGKGLGLGHYKSHWKVDGRADVSAKASLRERLRSGEVIATDDELATEVVLERRGNRRFTRTDHRMFHTDLDTRLGAGVITQTERDRLHRRWHRNR